MGMPKNGVPDKENPDAIATDLQNILCVATAEDFLEDDTKLSSLAFLIEFYVRNTS